MYGCVVSYGLSYELFDKLWSWAMCCLMLKLIYAVWWAMSYLMSYEAELYAVWWAMSYLMSYEAELCAVWWAMKLNYMLCDELWAELWAMSYELYDELWSWWVLFDELWSWAMCCLMSYEAELCAVSHSYILSWAMSYELWAMSSYIHKCRRIIIC